MTTRVRRRAILGLLLLAHALLAGAYSVWNPLAEAPDEADHFAYVRYLAARRDLPSGPRVTQSKHPPLYHITAALASTAGDPLDYEFLRANPDVSVAPIDHWSPNFFIHTTLEDWPWRGGPLAFHAARLWSVLLSTLTVLVTHRLVRAGFPSTPGLALAVAGVLAFIPEFAFIGGSVNNDSGAALAGALILWGVFKLYWRGGRWQSAWWTPLAMGAGLLIKVSTVALWPVVILAAALGAAADVSCSRDFTSWIGGARQNWRRWAGTSLLFLIVAVTIAAPWLVRNWRMYDSPLGQSLARQTVDLREAGWTLTDTVWLLRGWFLSFWGKFGGAGHIPMPSLVYWILAVASTVSALGLVRAWLGARPRTRAVLLLLALASLAVATAIWRYSLIALGTDQGRLLYPAVSAIVTLLVVGAAAWIPQQHQPAISVMAITALAVLSIAGLVGVIRPAFAPPKPPAASQVSASLVSEPVAFGPLSLIGWQLSDDPVLFWTASRQTEEDWRTNLRVIAEDGSLVWEWRRSPGYGRWSTDRWSVGTAVQDQYRIAWPAWAESGRYLIEVGVRIYGDELTLPVAADASDDRDHLYYPLGWIERQ